MTEASRYIQCALYKTLLPHLILLQDVTEAWRRVLKSEYSDSRVRHNRVRDVGVVGGVDVDGEVVHLPRKETLEADTPGPGRVALLRLDSHALHATPDLVVAPGLVSTSLTLTQADKSLIHSLVKIIRWNSSSILLRQVKVCSGLEKSPFGAKSDLEI